MQGPCVFCPHFQHPHLLCPRSSPRTGLDTTQSILLLQMLPSQAAQASSTFKSSHLLLGSQEHLPKGQILRFLYDYHMTPNSLKR